MIEPLAEAIRSHPFIRGFQFGHDKHIINLFADDIILLLTNPSTSLEQAHQILTEFGDISYYKVNFSKSLILSLGVPEHIQHTLRKTFPYSWSTKGINYLGVTLTTSTTTLVDANIKPLLTKLEAQLKEISKKELSWMGKLAAFKMLLLPQIIYIFRALPIHIPQHYIRNMLHLMCKFLWNGKKARCPKHNLIPHK